MAVGTPPGAGWFAAAQAAIGIRAPEIAAAYRPGLAGIPVGRAVAFPAGM